MKKSEMIALIDRELFNRKCMDEDPKGFDILEVIERAGMLPPEVDQVPQHIIDNGESANYWEPEDE